jgi:hypothetical protein
LTGQNHGHHATPLKPGENNILSSVYSSGHNHKLIY